MIGFSYMWEKVTYLYHFREIPVSKIDLLSFYTAIQKNNIKVDF